MKNGLTTLIAIAALLSAPSVFAEGAGIEWDILNDEVEELYRIGQYARAVVVGKKALKVAEEIVGPDHPDVATSLNILALLYNTQGQYAEAEPLYKQALGIYEKALGLDHLSVAASLSNLAGLYRATGRNLEAKRLETEEPWTTYVPPFWESGRQLGRAFSAQRLLSKIIALPRRVGFCSAASELKFSKILAQLGRANFQLSGR